MKGTNITVITLLTLIGIFGFSSLSFAESDREYWCKNHRDLDNIPKYCLKGDLLMLSGIYVTKFCDFNRPVVPLGNSKVACYYLGYERLQRLSK